MPSYVFDLLPVDIAGNNYQSVGSADFARAQILFQSVEDSSNLDAAVGSY